jgi:CheY-like chemotaxis protein
MPGAIELCKVLLVTDCSELRRALGFSLESQAEQVLAARNVREGKDMIAQHCDIDLVIADLLLPDGDGFALLRCVSLLEEPKPRVILIAGLPSPEDERLARAAGAIGCLAKPISYRDVAGVLHESSHRIRTRRLRRRFHGRALLIEDIGPGIAREASLSWQLRDLSSSGSFIETEPAISLGTELALIVELEGKRLPLRAQVARVQEPSWSVPGGIGVAFFDLADDVRKQLEEHVDTAPGEVS